MNPSQASITPTTLRLVRLAFLGSVLIVGGVFWFLATSGTAAFSMEAGLYDTMQMVFAGLLAAAGAALFVLQQRWKRAATFAEKAPLNLVGWALGEFPALFGAVVLLLSGGLWALYGAGLVFFALAWVLFPIPEAG